MGTAIVGWSMGLSSSWGSWPPRQGAEHADQVAHALADTAAGRDRVVEAVCELDAGVPDGPVLLTGLWVPDRAAGDPVGSVVAEILVGVPEGPDPVGAFVRGAMKAPRRRGLKTFTYSANVTVLPAGPAAVREWQWADKSDGIVICQLIWTVIADGASEALQVTFTTRAPAMADALALEAAQSVETLTVDLGDLW